jgi:hypothetical protein
MASQVVYSRGPYHGLPKFSQHEGKQYTALVLGASGITGAYLIRVLSRSSHWKRIVAVSRSKPHEALPDHVVHIPIDLLGDPTTISEAFKRHNIVPQARLPAVTSVALTTIQGLRLLCGLHPTQARARTGPVVQRSRNGAHQRCVCIRHYQDKPCLTLSNSSAPEQPAISPVDL